MTARHLLAGTLALAALAAAPSAASAAATCSTVAKGGGQWRSYGQDLTGQRFQRSERVIGPKTAANLTPAWVFNTTQNGADGTFQSTPIVADGCVFLGSSTGWAFAMNADTGALVWKRKFAVAAPGLLGSGAVGAPAIHDGKVIFYVSEAADGKGGGPYVVALDQKTGSVVWGPTVVSTTKFDYADASPIVHNGVLIAGFNGDETYDSSRGGFALLDAQTGKLLKRTYTIPDEEYNAGAGGGSIWATPVVDAATGYAYVGSSNPTGPVESARTNAILKIDLDRTRATFGQIVDSMKGTPDAVSPVTPACGKLPRIPGAPAGEGALSYTAIVGCTRADYDFGASPNMLSIGGRLAVAELQKSGVVHTSIIDGPKLERSWSAVTGPGFFYDNLATSASDGQSVYVTAGPPGQLFALDADTGEIRWAAPIGDLLHFQSVSVANGVVYTIDSLGFLWAYDAANGTPLLHRELRADGGDQSGFASPTSVGVAIARNSLYVADGNFIIRYAPGNGGGGGSGIPEPGGIPPIPVGASGAVVAGPGASTAGYVTPQAAVVGGGSVTFANGDAAQHDVVSTQRKGDGTPLFKSSLIGTGQTADVAGVKDLGPGSYPFVCSLHGAMKGTLTVLSPRSKRALPGATRAKPSRSLVDPTGRVINRNRSAK
jgi:polyvinyl alcohol dehydrogenase (cytochrome)